MSLPLVQLVFLDQLKGFVAVGRRMSITHAAADLCLTQSAVSRQILTLEQHLGVKLLARGHRSIAFTADGERLFRSADAAIRQLQDIMGDISNSTQSRAVTISASIGVTGLWLLPRLNAFQKLHPGIDIRLSASNRVGDLNKEGIDLAIRYTNAKLAPGNAVRLFEESIAPVAHPSLAIKPKKSGKLTVKWPLLEFDESQKSWLSWHDWLDRDDMQNAKTQGILRFNQYDQVIQAAVAGQGIALGRLELIQNLLDDGRLVQLMPARTQGQTGHAYWLLQAQETPGTERQQVMHWLMDEASKTREWILPVN
ncbi:LysR substrate-binding domain-containing protein [Undibacterium sp. Ji50W]|uniref:LysR substrate-binding domain-containing protein n=1 Tax=Undibacterium sp. Ji50W TaxID=3413041 RepID=UPI003BF42F20